MPEIFRDKNAMAAQKLAIASSVAALLMFGVLVKNGSQPQAAAPILAGASCAVPLTEDEIPKARRAVIDCLREAFPEAKVDGVFLMPLGRDGTIYLGRADAALPEGRRPLHTLVCQYVRRNGATYWRAQSLSSSEADAKMQQGFESYVEQSR